MALGSIDETMFARSIDPELTGMAPVPLSDAGIRASELNSRMMGLYSDIPHPLIQDAAWEFIRYYGSKEAMAIKTRIMVEGGLAQFVHPKYLRLFGYEALIKLAPPEWEETFNIAIKSSKPEPYGKHSTFIYNVLDGPVKKANELGLAGQLPEDREAREEVLLELIERRRAKSTAEISWARSQ